MEQKTAQLRVKPKVISGYGTAGTIFWETPARARVLLDSGGFELVNAGASEKPSTGPSETKPAGPLEKKYSAVVQDGHSTDSASSNEPGTAAPSSVSAEALRSPERIAPSSRPRGRPRKGP